MDKAEKGRLFRIACRVYAAGENVTQHLVTVEGAPRRVAIEIAYAVQSGTYTAFAATEVAAQTRREGHAILAAALARTGARTLLDMGAGEGTRWLDFDHPLAELTLLDASWSRLSHAPANLARVPAVAATRLVKGDMLTPPFGAASFDAVFTSHAIEPNTDPDAARIIRQIFELSRRLVVLFEPNYRDAPPQMRARMERHGYARNIWDCAQAQPGWTCTAQGDFAVSPNPDNRTSYLVFERSAPLPGDAPVWCAPVSGRALHETADGFRDADGAFAYPKIGGIACLAEDDGIFIGVRPA